MNDDHAKTIERLRRGLAYVSEEMGEIVCAQCRVPLNDGDGHCGSDMCPRCWGERVNEDRDSYPRTEPEEA